MGGGAYLAQLFCVNPGEGAGKLKVRLAGLGHAVVPHLGRPHRPEWLVLVDVFRPNGRVHGPLEHVPASLHTRVNMDLQQQIVRFRTIS